MIPERPAQLQIDEELSAHDEDFVEDGRRSSQSQHDKRNGSTKDHLRLLRSNGGGQPRSTRRRKEKGPNPNKTYSFPSPANGSTPSNGSGGGRFPQIIEPSPRSQISGGSSPRLLGNGSTPPNSSLSPREGGSFSATTPRGTKIETDTNKEQVFRRKAAYLVCEGFLDPNTVAELLGRSVGDVKQAVNAYQTHGEQSFLMKSLKGGGGGSGGPEQGSKDLLKRRRLNPRTVADAFPDEWPDLNAIQIMARIRPMNAREKAAGSGVCVSAPGPKEMLFKLNERELRKQAVGADFKRGKMKEFLSFHLDRGFARDAGQEEVYMVCGRPLLSKVMQGYNGCILAYGQTGAGKTYSMEGTVAQWRNRDEDLGSTMNPPNYGATRGSHGKTLRLQEQDKPGIIPRLIAELFMGIELLDGIVDVDVSITYIEIYMEQVIDLLNDPDDPPVRPPDVVEDKRPGGKGVFVRDALEEIVHSQEDIMRLIRKGQDNRRVAATDMNAHSSRSHAVLTLYISHKTHGDTQNISKRSSKLHLVDLAGSERLKDTNATGERMKEGNAINKSLSALGACLQSMTQSKKIPRWRESKITRLLQDSLGGNAFAVILAAVSPALCNEDESLSTIRFTTLAQKIKAKPKQNLDPMTVMKNQNRDLRRRVMQLGEFIKRNGLELPEDLRPQKRRPGEKGRRRLPRNGAKSTPTNRQRRGKANTFNRTSTRALGPSSPKRGGGMRPPTGAAGGRLGHNRPSSMAGGADRIRSHARRKAAFTDV